MQKENSIPQVLNPVQATVSATVPEVLVSGLDAPESVTVINPVHEFLQNEYELRRNLISGKIEFRERGADAFRVLTMDELNSVLLAAEAALPDQKRLRDRLCTIIYSRATPDFDPAAPWLASLPPWDGKNHVDALFNQVLAEHGKPRHPEKPRRRGLFGR